MKTDIPLLQNVRVASPCPASWEGMTVVDGNRVHFCQECQKRVYNLSAMSQAEAEGLLRTHEGRLCIRYYRRSDGTVLTNDCPVGLQAARQLVFRKAKTSFAICLLFCGALLAERMTTPTQPTLQGGPALSPPTDTLKEDMGTPAPLAPQEDVSPKPVAGRMEMGFNRVVWQKSPPQPQRTNKQIGKNR